MRITKPRRPGEMIIVDLLKPSTLSPDGWLKPIEFETNEPPTLYVRVPHGRFAVRVMASTDCDVMVHVDGAKALETKVTKGIHIFDRASDGKLFNFGQAGEAPASDSPEMVQQTLFESGEQAECVKTHGQVAVHVRFADVDNGTGRPDITPDYPQPVFFQMNAPGDHEEALAGLLRKLKAPEKITEAHEVFGEDNKGAPLPQRICVNCQHEH